MRVNMDSSIVSDPRFKIVAKRLGVSWREVIGSCFLLWLAAYERRSKCFSKIEADIAAELDGFSNALCVVGLADDNKDDTINVHGVDARISFLESQSRKGKKGGKNSGKSRHTTSEANALATPEAYASANAQANGSGSAQAYPLTLTPTLSLNTPLPPKGEEREKNEPPDFVAFWDWYPRQYARPSALRAWLKLDPDQTTITDIAAGILKWKKSAQWKKDGGAMIPSPAKFLRQRLWESPPLSLASNDPTPDEVVKEMLDRREQNQ